MEITILIFISWCVAIAHFAMKQEREADAEIMELAIDEARIDGYEMGKLVPEVCERPYIRFNPTYGLTLGTHIEKIEAVTRVHDLDNFPEKELHRYLSKDIAEEIVKQRLFAISRSESEENYQPFSYVKMTVAVIRGEDIINAVK